MSASAPHANAAITELLGLSAQQRIRAIRSERWVSYPRVQKTLRILEQILDHPRTTRMPSIAIFGDSGMGKIADAEVLHGPSPGRRCRNRATSNARPGASDDEQARRASLLCSNS
jgi:hypothetical protein